MVSEIAATPDSPITALNRRRLSWGAICVLMAAIFGSAVGMLWSWVRAHPRQILHFVMPDGQLLLCAFLLSGLAAAVGLVLLVAPMIRRIPHRWVRRLSGILAISTIVASAALWLLFLLYFSIMAILSTNDAKVSAEDGQSIVVRSGGTDPSTYIVYTQRSTYIYEYHSGGRRNTNFPGTGHTKPFESDPCVLETNDADLLLTCEEVIVRLPNSVRRSN